MADDIDLPAWHTDPHYHISFQKQEIADEADDPGNRTFNWPHRFIFQPAKKVCGRQLRPHITGSLYGTGFPGIGGKRNLQGRKIDKKSEPVALAAPRYHCYNNSCKSVTTI